MRVVVSHVLITLILLIVTNWAFGHCAGACEVVVSDSSYSSGAAVSAASFSSMPDKAAILVVSSHPDDESIFFGGTLPYYSRIRNLPTVLLSMTSGDWDVSSSGHPSDDGSGFWRRERELRNAANVYGVQYDPLLPRLRDIPTSLSATWDFWGDWTEGSGVSNTNDFNGNQTQGRMNAALYIAQQVRDLKPEVIATHDFGGEYGHANHRAAPLAVAAAWDLAAGRNADIEGTIITPGVLTGDLWEASKVYMHLYEDGTSNLFHLGWEESRVELGGDSVRDVANKGLDQHVSQGAANPGGHDVATIFEDGEGIYSENLYNSELWGLFASTVGADSEMGIPTGLRIDPDGTSYLKSNDPVRHYGDFFENIDLSLFADYLADADKNGVVDEEDLAIIESNFGLSVPIGSVALGDATGDGLVNEADLALLYIANPSLVPEPASLALLGLSGLIMLHRRL